mmetsp:Transcript_8836/g.15038  ORF Transcript_8836/g.15038 Transcript_8836/m.15038 type:complete len:284 (-) Transcript_8836:34-885(-)
MAGAHQIVLGGAFDDRHVVDLLQVSRFADKAQIAQHLGLIGGGTASCVVHGNAAVTVRVIKLVGAGLQVLNQLQVSAEHRALQHGAVQFEPVGHIVIFGMLGQHVTHAGQISLCSSSVQGQHASLVSSQILVLQDNDFLVFQFGLHHGQQLALVATTLAEHANLGLQPGQQPHFSRIFFLRLVASGQGLQGNQTSHADIAEGSLQGFVRGCAEENEGLSGLEGSSGQVKLSQQLKGQLASTLRSRGTGSDGLVVAAVTSVVSTLQQTLVRVHKLLVRQGDWVP